MLRAVFKAIVKPFSIRTCIWLVFVFIAGCATVEESFMAARNKDSIESYEAFLKSYPENLYHAEAKGRLDALKSAKDFREAERQNTIEAYKDFICKYPKSAYAEEARKRAVETDEEAFKRAYADGSLQAFRCFLTSNPDSRYSDEVKERVKWLEHLKIGVVVNISSLPVEDREAAERRVKARLKPLLAKNGEGLVFFKTPDEAEGKELSAIVSVGYSRFERRVKYSTGQFASALTGGFVGGGPIGLLVALPIGLMLEPGVLKPSVVTESEGWRAVIINGNPREAPASNYIRAKQSKEIDDILNDANFFEKVREAETISWLSRYDRPPAAFSKAALQSPDSYYKWKTVQLSRDIDLYLLALKDKDMIVRLEAVKELAKLKDPKSIEPLIAALKDNEKSIQMEAVKALGLIGDDRAVEPLIEALKDAYWTGDLKQETARSLGKIGDTRAVEPLTALLNDIEWDVRLEAAEALREITGESLSYDIAREAEARKKQGSSVEDIIPSLKDQNPSVRLNAAELLGGLKDSRAVEPLIATLKDKDWDVRRYSAISLGKIGDKRAEAPLKTLAENDPEPDVRKAAEDALKAMR